MLIYSLLHLSGYDVSLDDLKSFRQLGSKTPGHPEVHHTDGVEVTTGPLGQGLATAVGMAMAEKHLAAQFNTDGAAVVDHYTYVIASDGDLQEGVTNEACSLAGHLGLGKLIVSLRRQPGLHRRTHRPLVHRGPLRALRSAGLARHPRRRRP